MLSTLLVLLADDLYYNTRFHFSCQHFYKKKQKRMPFPNPLFSIEEWHQVSLSCLCVDNQRFRIEYDILINLGYFVVFCWRSF